MQVQEKQALMALTYVNKLGTKSVQALLAVYGTASEVWKLSTREKNSIKGLTPEIVGQIGSKEIWDLAAKEMKFCEEHDIQIVSIFENEYSKLLKECSDAPLITFKRGNYSLNHGKYVSIVGTRKMTSRGKDFVHELVAGFKNEPITIVSGLALGVDAEAHKAAIENGLPTIGVLAHGVNQIFPKTNERIGRKMMDHGGLFSEFSTFHAPEPENFLRRNRIIAGLCEATIIIESAIAGGAMSTATHANNYNRDVFALSGRPNDATAIGCHHLIKNHKAFLLTEAADVLNYLNITPRKTEKVVQKELFISLSEPEKTLYDLLKKNGKLHIDKIALDMRMPSYHLMPILLDLELKNLISPLPGKYYDLN